MTLKLREGLGQLREGGCLIWKGAWGEIHLGSAPHSEQIVSPETGFTLRAHGRLLTRLKILRLRFPLSPSEKWGYHFDLGQNHFHKAKGRKQEEKCIFPALPESRQNS